LSNAINFTKLSQICTCQSWYIPVFTGMDQYILGMNWSVLVQTSIYQYILVYTCINNFMTFSQCTYRGHTLSYWYSPSLISSKKSVRRTRSLKPAIFCILFAESYPALRGTHLDTGMLTDPFLSIYRYWHYLCTWCLMPYRRRRSCSSMLGTQHVAVQRPTLYPAESLGYMLLARPICQCELSVLEQ
jgi:hypothetical protein